MKTTSYRHGFFIYSAITKLLKTRVMEKKLKNQDDQ